MTEITAARPDRMLAGEAVGDQTKIGQADTVLATDIAASELLVQLGHEYFSLGAPSGPDPSPPKANVDSAAPRIEPRSLANASPPNSQQRDFWEEVAATTERITVLPQSALGVPNDPISYAIAAVAASYTFAATERRATGPTGGTPPGTSQLHNRETPQTSGETRSARSKTENADLFDALLSLLSFEEIADLSSAVDLAPSTFSQARELAASAMAAAATNRNSALKAAEGRKG